MTSNSDIEKKEIVEVISDDKVLSIQDSYDYEDPTNYYTSYSDEFNPRGLRKPTDDELKNLARVIGNIKYSVFILCICEFAERASYYSTIGILTNYIQRRVHPDSHTAGEPRHLEIQTCQLVRWARVANCFSLEQPFEVFGLPFTLGWWIPR